MSFEPPTSLVVGYKTVLEKEIELLRDLVYLHKLYSLTPELGCNEQSRTIEKLLGQHLKKLDKNV